MRKFFPLITALICVLASCTKQDNKIDLSGSWQVSLDSLQTFDAITLPGTTDAAGLGEPNTLEPALTSPQVNRLTRKHSFLGAAFYKRNFEVPASMEGKPLTLTLERVIWQSSVWIDGVQLDGAEESLTTAHTYEIPQGLSAGTHEIMLRIDNRKRYDISWRELAHAYTNDTQVIWNGVLGELSLTAHNDVEIAQVEVYPDVDSRSARVVTTLVRHNPELTQVKLRYGVGSLHVNSDVPLDGDVTTVEQTIALGSNAALWDEFSPKLHTLKLQCEGTSREVQFGLRSFKADGDHFAVNGRRTFLRGTLNCCIYPLSGTPPLDEAGWEKEFRVCQEWGLNHVRFHSWCPPDAAFRVADRLGIYLQVELPVWAHGRGKEVDEFMRAEAERILKAYGNHPSFCMLACGNELDNGYEFLNELMSDMKKADPRHLYTNCSYTMGFGHKGKAEPEDEFMVASRTVLGQIRGQDYIDSRTPNFYSNFDATARGVDVPLISHEIGQYCVYPSMKEIEKYTGTLIPLNFLGVKAELEKKGLLDRAEEYTMASGKLSALLYKEEVERALRTKSLAGFQLLGLQDFSGQSTALVGLVDAFWDNKGLVTEEWFRQACSPVTPLALFEKPWWTTDETFVAEIEIANFWSKDITGNVSWKLASEEVSVASGTVAVHVPTGGNTRLETKIEADLSTIQEPVQLKLTVALDKWSNSWDVWVYPAGDNFDQGEVVLASTLAEAMPVLQQGGTVLMSPTPWTITGEKGKFVPVFWSPVFFPFEAGTMGVLCDPEHPGLASFPTESHSNWQWWNLTKNSRAVSLDNYPQVESIVEAVDNFTMNRRLSYIFECQCESGRLIFSTMDLLSPQAMGRPETRQMLSSLLDYMNSPEFNPSGVMTPDQLDGMFHKLDFSKIFVPRHASE